MCSQPATSKEHAPPKCLFPEQKDLEPGQDLRVNLIKVPSCDKHNTEKSDNDVYLLYALVGNVLATSTAKAHFATKVMRSIAHNPSLLKRIGKTQLPVLLENNSDGEKSNQIAVAVAEPMTG